MVEGAFTRHILHFTTEHRALLGQLLKVFRLLLFGLEMEDGAILGFHMLASLLKDAHILHTLLTESVGLFEILLVNLREGLLVVSLRDLPGDTASEFTV